jgi:Fic family protein
LPDPDLFLYMNVRKEAVLSSQIEGTQSSLSDLLLHEHHAAPHVPTDDVKEVSRYVAATLHSVERLRTLPLSMRLIKEAHGVLLRDARGSDKTPGEVRRSQNWIGGSMPGNAVFVPPPHELLGEVLGSLENFIHTERAHLSSVFKAGLVHAQFETIHPFLDGNGRVGRLLVPLVLMHEGLIDAPIFYLSLYFKQHRDQYYEKLQRIRTHGEWEAWLHFFTRGVALVAEAAASTIANVHALFERDRSRITLTADRTAATLLRLFDYAKLKAVLAVPEVAVALNVTQPTVNAAIKKLVELGIVREVTGKQRDRRYMYTAYVDMLSEERELSATE